LFLQFPKASANAVVIDDIDTDSNPEVINVNETDSPSVASVKPKKTDNMSQGSKDKCSASSQHDAILAKVCMYK
jgi:hypothetical protein